MKFLEAIDWKLWEMLKLMRADREEKNEDKDPKLGYFSKRKVYTDILQR